MGAKLAIRLQAKTRAYGDRSMSYLHHKSARKLEKIHRKHI